MSEATKQNSPVRDRAISAWESAVARTMNPHLNDRQANALWSAVLKNREKPDADAFAKATDEILDGAPSPIRYTATTLVDNLRDILRIK